MQHETPICRPPLFSVNRTSGALTFTVHCSTTVQLMGFQVAVSIPRPQAQAAVLVGARQDGPRPATSMAMQTQHRAIDVVLVIQPVRRGHDSRRWSNRVHSGPGHTTERGRRKHRAHPSRRFSCYGRPGGLLAHPVHAIASTSACWTIRPCTLPAHASLNAAGTILQTHKAAPTALLHVSPRTTGWWHSLLTRGANTRCWRSSLASARRSPAVCTRTITLPSSFSHAAMDGFCCRCQRLFHSHQGPHVRQTRPGRLLPLPNVPPHVRRAWMAQRAKLVQNAEPRCDGHMPTVMLQEHAGEVLPEEARNEPESSQSP